MLKRFFRDRVIAYKKKDEYLAVSLEFDLLAEGKTIIEALNRLHDATAGYLDMCCSENEPEKEIYRRAPKKYQDMYDLFVELSEKKKKKEDEKKREKAFRVNETQSAQLTYTPNILAHG